MTDEFMALPIDEVESLLKLTEQLIAYASPEKSYETCFWCGTPNSEDNVLEHNTHTDCIAYLAEETCNSLKQFIANQQIASGRLVLD